MKKQANEKPFNRFKTGEIFFNFNSNIYQFLVYKNKIIFPYFKNFQIYRFYQA